MTFEPQKQPLWFESFQNTIFKAAGCESIGFDACNINYYPDGHYKLDPHADDEPIFGDPKGNIPILSLSIGADRIFQLIDNKTKDVRPVLLRQGDLLFMGGNLQSTHKHALPQSRNTGPRLNFTWRVVANHDYGCLSC